MGEFRREHPGPVAADVDPEGFHDLLCHGLGGVADQGVGSRTGDLNVGRALLGQELTDQAGGHGASADVARADDEDALHSRRGLSRTDVAGRARVPRKSLRQTAKLDATSGLAFMMYRAWFM